MNKPLGRILSALAASIGLIASVLVASQTAMALPSHVSGGDAKVSSVAVDYNVTRLNAQSQPTYTNSSQLVISNLPADIQFDQTNEAVVGLSLNAVKAKALADTATPMKFVLTTYVPGGMTLVNNQTPSTLTKNQASVVFSSSVPGVTASFTDAKNGTITLPAGLNTAVEFLFTLKLSPAGYTSGMYQLNPAIYDNATAPSAIGVNTTSPYAPTDLKAAVSTKRYAYTALIKGASIPAAPAFSRVTYNVTVCTDPKMVKLNDNLVATASWGNSDYTLDAAAGSWFDRPSTVRAAINTTLKLNATDISKGVRGTAAILVTNTSGSDNNYPGVDLSIYNTTTLDEVSAPCAAKPTAPRISINASTRKMSVEVPSTVPNTLGGAIAVTVWPIDSTYQSVAKAQFDVTNLTLPTAGYYKKFEVNLVKPTALVTSTTSSDQFTVSTKTDYVAKISFIDTSEVLVSADSDQSNFAADIAQPIVTGSDDVLYGLNAGGNVVTLTGRNFGATGNQKIVDVVFSSPWSDPVSATNFVVKPLVNSIIVTIPAYANVAADLGQPSVTHPVSRDIKLKLQDGSLVYPTGMLSYKYIGTSKATQTVTMEFQDWSFTGLVTDSDFGIMTTQSTNISGWWEVKPTLSAKSVPVVANTSVCSIVNLSYGDYVHFNGGAGDCVITATGAATAAYDKVTQTKTYTVVKPDAITVNDTYNVSSYGTMSGGTLGFIPEISSTSGRPITLTIDPASVDVCETPTVDSPTKKVGTVYAKPGMTWYNYCTIIATTPADNSQWKQATKTFSLSVGDSTLGTSANPITLDSDTDPAKYVSLNSTRYDWNATTGDLIVTSRSRYIGAVTATLKFTDKTGVAQTCVANFGILTKITGSSIWAIQNAKSATLCSDATVKTKLKAAVAAKKALQQYLPVTISITRALNRPDTNAVYQASEVIPKVYLNLN